jgi:hypothetical protein
MDPLGEIECMPAMAGDWVFLPQPNQEFLPGQKKGARNFPKPDY